MTTSGVASGASTSVSGLAIVTIESRAVPIWRNTFEPISRIQPEMFMICSTKGIAVATIAVVIVPGVPGGERDPGDRDDQHAR